MNTTGKSVNCINVLQQASQNRFKLFRTETLSGWRVERKQDAGGMEGSLCVET